METIENEFKKYNDYKLELAKAKRDLYRSIMQDVKVSGSNFEVNGDIRPTGYMASNIENQIINKADLEIQLESKIKDLESKIDLLDNLVNILPFKDRRIFNMRYKLNMDWQSIADDTELTIDTVKKSRQRSLKRMANIIGTEFTL